MRRRLGVGVAVALAIGTRARAGGLLVVAPHPDDEVLAAGGLLATALAAGRDVHVAVVTNGDYYGTDYGLSRETESVNALGLLGLPENDVVFLGYPDAGLLSVWNDAPGTGDAYLSPRSGRKATYGDRGYGRTDWHTAVTGVPGPYNRPTLVDDVRGVLAHVDPDEIVVTGPFDEHPDHRATFYAVRDAARLVAAADGRFRPLLETTIVHDPLDYPFDDFWPVGTPHDGTLPAGDDDAWPNPAASSGVPRRFDPTVPFVMPPSLPRTILDWTARVSRAVPPAMRVAAFDQNLKAQALSRYRSQASDVLWSHAKADEFYWADAVRVGSYSTNVARGATASASSAAPGQGAAQAIDGVVDGAPAAPGTEWAVAGPATAHWLHLAWPAPVLVDRVVLYDRVGLGDRVTAGRLVLDDGTVVRVPALANDGRGDEVVLDRSHRIRSLTFTVDEDVGTPGLAELETFGTAASPLCRTAMDCVPPGPCSVASCRGGLCVSDPVADGTPCGDEDACNGVEACRAGTCARDPAQDCADDDPCTADTCVAPGACEHASSCAPVPVAGRGGCRLGVVGIPRGLCEDGDPACDADRTSDGACSFRVILCTDPGPASARCDFRAPVASVRVRRKKAGGLAELAALLDPRLPVTGRTCVGPVAVRVALAGRLRRRVAREHVPFVVTLADGRKLHAVLKVGCRPAPVGGRRRPPAPLAP
jgi:LmbE family N-acetylglucosaminyl deacetylase